MGFDSASRRYEQLEEFDSASLGENNLWSSIQRAEDENKLWGSIQRAWVRTTCGVRFSEPKVVVKLVGVGLHNFGF